MQSFNVKKVSDVKVKKQCQINISNTFAIVENPEEITGSSETDIKVSVTEFRTSQNLTDEDYSRL